MRAGDLNRGTVRVPPPGPPGPPGGPAMTVTSSRSKLLPQRVRRPAMLRTHGEQDHERDDVWQQAIADQRVEDRRQPDPRDLELDVHRLGEGDAQAREGGVGRPPA